MLFLAIVLIDDLKVYTLYCYKFTPTLIYNTVVLFIIFKMQSDTQLSWFKKLANCVYYSLGLIAGEFLLVGTSS